jgi:hypothetical protein
MIKSRRRLLRLHGDRFDQPGLPLFNLDNADLVETVAIGREGEGSEAPLVAFKGEDSLADLGAILPCRLDRLDQNVQGVIDPG